MYCLMISIVTVTPFTVKRQMLCDNCKMETDAIYVDDSTLYTMQYIVSAELRKLYTFMVSEEVLDRLEMVLNRCFAAQTSHQFQSLDILKTIAG